MTIGSKWVARFIVSGLFLQSAACTTAPPTAQVPVGIACVKRADMPTRPAPLANSAMPADVRDREPLYLRQLFDWGTYAGRVDAAVAGCP